MSSGVMNPEVAAVPFLDRPRPAAFAHRGGSAHAPENTWRAFEYAVKLGYAYLETDASAPIGSLRYADLTALRVAGTEPIPLLEDLIGAWPDVRFNIDLKDEGAIMLLPEVLRRTGAWDRVCVTSFSGARLRVFRGLADRPVCLAVSPASVAAVRLTPALPAAMAWQARRLDRAHARCAQVPGRVASPAFIRRAHALGLVVHVWTINDKADMHRLLDLGADGIMTDQIALLREVLTERGQWHPRDS